MGGRVAALLLLAAASMAAGVLYGWTHVARALPPLQGWHLQAPPSEFVAADARRATTSRRIAGRKPVSSESWTNW